VNSVAGLLKQFFRDLPDPLFTSQAYSSFIDAARKPSGMTSNQCLMLTYSSRD
jgi:hypothetical protein